MLRVALRIPRPAPSLPPRCARGERSRPVRCARPPRRFCRLSRCCSRAVVLACPCLLVTTAGLGGCTRSPLRVQLLPRVCGLPAAPNPRMPASSARVVSFAGVFHGVFQPPALRFAPRQRAPSGAGSGALKPRSPVARYSRSKGSRRFRFARGCGRCAPLGERSRPAAAVSFVPPRFARPHSLARGRVRRFSSRFARSCVSPRLAARGSALRSASLRSPSLSVAPLRSPRLRSSRPRVPLAAPALCAPCGACGFVLPFVSSRASLAPSLRGVAASAALRLASPRLVVRVGRGFAVSCSLVLGARLRPLFGFCFLQLITLSLVAFAPKEAQSINQENFVFGG